ncbi:uncharacterized protein LOC119584400 [Penaeus monodon]|uniref:uncharacterized protein LOC119584400 n=1 Tax=Penaeus monodon TaxID=6687 RepID=UPI0018A6DBC7|nr:uncharacterized protein LOC119584400 [Penaeus monodon]
MSGAAVRPVTPREGMAGPGESPGISLSDLRRLRYQCVVNRYGRHVLVQVFNWSYTGGSLSVKEKLFQEPHFSNAQYKKLFNAHHRARLESGEPVSGFDISLLYQLLRHACALDADDGRWVAEDPGGPSLENLLYKIKMHRNNLAHEDLRMTQEDMEDKLEELRRLFVDAISKAGRRFSRPDDEVATILEDINSRIDHVYKKIREPLGAEDIAQYQQDVKEMRNHLESSIKEAAREELEQLYSRFYEIRLLPWLLMDCQVNPTQIFTKFTLKEETSLAGEQTARKVTHNGILEVRRADGSAADVLIVVGDGGMGKTTYLKYLMEMWIKDPSSVPGLGQVELLFYIECRNPSIASLDQLIRNLLHDTPRNINVEYGHVRETVLHMQILILIDGFDEVNEASRQVIQEVLHLPGHNVRLLLTTRPGSLSALCALVPHSRRRLVLLLEGITKEHHSQFAGRLCDSFVPDEETRTTVKMAMEEQLTRLDTFLGTHLNSPLNLTLFTMLIIQDPTITETLTTATALYVLLTKLVNEKVTERISCKVWDPDIAHKISQFEDYSDSLAFRAMKRREYELRPDTVERLRGKCRELGLPHEELMSAFFTARSCRRGLFSVLAYSYHHLRLQEFYTARHLHRSIVHSQNAGDVVHSYLTDSVEWKSEQRFQNVLVHLTGLLARHGEHLVHAPCLLSLVHLPSTVVDPLLAHVVEAGLHPLVVQAAAAELQAHSTKWDGWAQVKEPSSLSALAPVLDEVPECVKLLALTAFSRSPADEQLAAAFRALSRKDVRLVLDLPHFYFSDRGSSITEETIRLISAASQTCCLEGFRGRLTPSALRLLPRCLKELRLRVDLGDVLVLNDILPGLPNLEILGLKYEDPERYEVTHLPPLPFPGRKLSFTFTPTLTDSEDDLQWASGVLARLCSLRPGGNCTSIFFKDTQLTDTGIRKLFELLHQKGVRVSQRLDISLTQRPPDKTELGDLATSLGLGNFICHSNARGATRPSFPPV